MSGVARGEKQNSYRARSTHNRKWKRKEELALIDFIKNNSNFELPNSRTYYTKFLFESGIDVEWKNVKSKIRNMRVTYRRAKEHEIKEVDSSHCDIRVLRNQILRICWFVDDFDILFPNEMDNSACLHIYKNPDLILDDDFSKDEPFNNVNNSSKNLNNDFLHEEYSSTTSLSNIMEGNILTVPKNFRNLKKQKPVENTSLKQQEPDKVKDISICEKEKFLQSTRLKELESETKSQQTPYRDRTVPIKKWRHNEEVSLISYLKQNRNFEHPNARIYYRKFLSKSGIVAQWKSVRGKVRNMRLSYRKAKKHEMKEVDSKNYNARALRSQIIKICWFVDDFDDLFPNEMNNFAHLHMPKTPDRISDDGFSKEEPFNNVNNSSENLNNDFLLEGDLTTSSLSNSIDESIFRVQNNFLNLKKQKRDEDKSLKQQELELAKEKLKFEKEKFRQEIRLKEKEIENEEKLKVLEFQMKERIALKKLEIEKMQALRSTQKPENSYNNIYHNMA